jgi:TP901 family phage tail tape measure protein
MAANVKIKLIIDDSGALQTLKEFNKAVQEISASQKGLNKQFNRTFSNVGKQAKIARDNFKQLGVVARNGFKKTRDGARGARKEVGLLGKAGSQIRNIFAGVFIADTLRNSIQAIKNSVVGAVRTFATFEEKLVAVGKTAGLEGQELRNLGEDIKRLNVPVSNQDLLDLATVAGQLGIKGSSNITKFTKTMAKLQVATDVSGEAGAQAIARILNVTGEAVDTVDVFGSVLTRLGNNTAATESQILSMANEVARSTSEFDLSSETVLGVSAALAGLGARAEGSGTAIGKVFRKMSSSISEGGVELENFASIMGVTGAEFTNMFESNPTEAFVQFIEALEKGRRGGVKINTQLASVGLNTDRLAKVIPVLSTRIDEFRGKLALANDEVKKNSALDEEAEKAFKTLTAEWTKFSKVVSGLAIDFVTKLAPAFKTILKDATKLFQVLRRPFKPEIDKQSLTELQETFRLTQNEILSGYARIRRTGKRGFLNKAILKKEQENLDKLVVKLQDVQRRMTELQAPTETPDAGEDGESRTPGLATKEDIKQQEANTREILRLSEENFQAQRELALLEHEQEKLLQDEKIQQLQDFLGTREALVVAAHAQSLRELGKTHQAELFLEKKLADARKKQEVSRVKFENLTNKEKVEQTNHTFGLLAQATAGGGKKLFAITKALQKAQAITAGILAVQNAFANPAFPYPFNIVNAAAQAAITAGNVSRISAQQAPSFEQGGIVPGTSFSGDNVQANVNSGEMILNRQQQSNLFKQVNTPGGEGNKEIVVHTNVQIDEETIFKAVSRQVANGAELGEQT